MKRMILVILMGLNLADATAQEKDTADVPYTHFTASLNFVNNYVWVGRPAKDIYPYLTPALTWTHKSGAYVSGSMSFLTKKDQSQLDLTYLTAGFDREFGNFEGNLEVNKYWYNSNSANPKSDINSDITLTGTYVLGPVNVTGSAYAMFSKKATDWGASLGLDHYFYFLDEKLEIIPSLVMYAGTTKYFGKYISRQFAPPNQNGVTYEVSADLSDATRFKILDYELSVPVSYYFNKFTFSFTPTVAFPVNPATAVLQIKPSNGPALQPRYVTENLKNVFFFALDVAYEF